MEDFSMSHSLVLNLKSFYEQIPKYVVDTIENTLEIGLNNLYGNTGEYSELTLVPLIEIKKYVMKMA